jgi:sec-independent protein translocase protein TatC
MAASPGDPARDAGARKLRRPRSRRTENPEARMPLVEHIRELRRRVLRALLAVLAGTVVAWIFYHHIWDFLQAPYCRLHLHSSAQALQLPGQAATGKGCTLYVTGIFDGLFMQVKICIAVGVIGSAPLWMYQLWAFIAPGLHARERRWAYFFAGSAVPLFALGGTVAYFAMSKGLHFLLGILPNQVFPIITINAYLSYAMAMLLIFGLAFELPLVMILLNVAGILSHARFRKWRRMIIFGVFAFAAIATPSPDPISMLLLAVPCVILVEAAEVFVWANDRRKAKRGTAYAGLTPEEITEYGLTEEPVLTNDLDAPR